MSSQSLADVATTALFAVHAAVEERERKKERVERRSENEREKKKTADGRVAYATCDSYFFAGTQATRKLLLAARVLLQQRLQARDAVVP